MASRFSRPAAALALALGAALAAGAAGAGEDFAAREGGPSERAMLARGDAGLKGLAFVRPVLSGVLWRAGFHGGDRKRTGLSQGQREALCEAGFSRAFYADFGRSTKYGETACAAGSLDYRATRSAKPANVMKAVHETVKDPSAGPVLVHCMWGVHASGAISAMALVQFCGWSEARAKAYWQKARNKAPCAGGCDRWIDAKFAAFEPDPALKITAAERAAICPK